MLNFRGDGFFCGVNYWESVHATRMWREFDEDIVDKDMKAMRAAGITVLRVFPLWSDFQPLTAMRAPDGIFEMGIDGDALPDTDAGRAGVSEVMCRRFECFCRLAEKNGLSLMVALITGQMSFGLFVPPALEGRSPLTDPLVMRWQLRFVKYFVRRFRHEVSIVGWDTGNETNCMGECDPDSFYVWMSAIVDAVRLCDPTRPVISGLATRAVASGRGNMHDVGELCDVHTVHPYNIFELKTEPLCSMRSVLQPVFRCRIGEDISGVPTFVQEFGATGYLTCGEEEEAAFYRGVFLACFAHRLHGLMWWCAFDQGHITFAPYNWNNIGSCYGFFRKDRQEKKITAVNRECGELLSLFPRGLPPYLVDCVIVVPRDEGNGNVATDLAGATFALAKRAGLDARFCYALDPIPEAPLYIFPSLTSNMAIKGNRLRELLARVENGATLFLSLDSALFRDIPTLAGVTVHSRIERATETWVLLDGARVPVRSRFRFRITPTTAEVLAYDEAGDPVLFRNAYGKGYICFTALPVERSVAELPGAFYEEDVPLYERFYHLAAALAVSDKLAVVDSPFIRATEHVINDNTRYLFAINYGERRAKALVRIPDGWRLVSVYGAAPAEGVLTLDGCDGAILRMEKE